MGQDEAGTLVRLKALRRELIDPKVSEHRGRIVKTTGDGILVEFPSVVEAVACAVAVQQGMAQRNKDTPPDQRIEFRIGIEPGDIIVEDGSVAGDGVNVASRLLKGWPHRAGSACRRSFTTRCRAGSIAHSRMLESGALKTFHVLFGSIMCVFPVLYRVPNRHFRYLRSPRSQFFAVPKPQR